MKLKQKDSICQGKNLDQSCPNYKVVTVVKISSQQQTAGDVKQVGWFGCCKALNYTNEQKSVQYFNDELTSFTPWRLFPVCLENKKNIYVFLVKGFNISHRYLGTYWEWNSLWTAQ